MKVRGRNYRTVWLDRKTLKMIDQTCLPHSFRVASFKKYFDVADAIRTMVVRGAPAIGAAAGFGLALAALSYRGRDAEELRDELASARAVLAGSRPTAYDLFDALDYVFSAKDECSVEKIKLRAATLAQQYADISVERCRRIGVHGARLIKSRSSVLTHCNAGALAAVDFGTALAPIRFAHKASKKLFVFVDETRPRCQGSRLTAWELAQEKIPHAVIADNAAGHYMRTGRVSLCIVGADRIALSGDVANKIGTYEKAVLAKENRIPFYVAAPVSTFDMNAISGDSIPIEERSPDEVTHIQGKNMNSVRVASPGSPALNPAFDVTPARYITGIITEKGVIRPNKAAIRGLARG